MTLAVLVVVCKNMLFYAAETYIPDHIVETGNLIDGTVKHVRNSSR